MGNYLRLRHERPQTHRDAGSRAPRRSTMWRPMGGCSYARTIVKSAFWGWLPGQTAETDLSCLDASDLVGSISDDGDSNRRVRKRRERGAKGEHLSAQDRWIAAGAAGRWTRGGFCRRMGSGFQVLLLSIQPRASIQFCQQERVRSALSIFLKMKGLNIVFGWRPDGETLLVFGPGKTRNYQNFQWKQKVRRASADRTGGPGRRASAATSPDGRRILTSRRPDGGWWVYPVDGGNGIAVKTISQHETPIGWRSDNRSIFLLLTTMKTECYRFRFSMSRRASRRRGKRSVPRAR